MAAMCTEHGLLGSRVAAHVLRMNDPAPTPLDPASPLSDTTPPAPPAPKPPEQGGPKGPEPTRYGDWERGGRAYDF